MYIVNPRETTKNIFKRGVNNKLIWEYYWNINRIIGNSLNTRKDREKRKKGQME